MNNLGDRLTYLREKKGWTKTYVAKKLGIKTMSTYANWEYSLRQPDNEMLLKIAGLYEVSVDYLLTGEFDENTTGKETTTKEITSKDERDIAKRMDELRDDLSSATGLLFNGEPMSEEAKESLLEAMEFGIRLAKKNNKKFIPKKYRDKEE
ncbi:helix-turn-helix domain-containing protein [Lysinibacillus sp. NPDC058147]|uniref:helix-turn-helix domain-containing protein n=1 Tax=unclassified Lysinibacillus TaxID=2636778 RepID=UPI0036DA4FB4